MPTKRKTPAKMVPYQRASLPRIETGQAHPWKSAIENIADSTNGLNQRALKAAVDLVPKVIDIDIDDIRKGVEMNIPDMLRDHRPGQDPVRVPKEVFEKGIFLGGQFDFLSGPADVVGDRIEGQVVRLKQRRDSAPSAEERADAG